MIEVKCRDYKLIQFKAEKTANGNTYYESGYEKVPTEGQYHLLYYDNYFIPFERGEQLKKIVEPFLYKPMIPVVSFQIECSLVSFLNYLRLERELFFERELPLEAQEEMNVLMKAEFYDEY